MGDLGAKEERTKAGARDAMELDLELEASSPSAELDSLKSASEESEREEIEAGPGEPRRALRASAHHAVDPLKTDDDAEDAYGSVEESLDREESSSSSDTPEDDGHAAKQSSGTSTALQLAEQRTQQPEPPTPVSQMPLAFMATVRDYEAFG